MFVKKLIEKLLGVFSVQILKTNTFKKLIQDYNIVSNLNAIYEISTPSAFKEFYNNINSWVCKDGNVLS